VPAATPTVQLLVLAVQLWVVPDSKFQTRQLLHMYRAEQVLTHFCAELQVCPCGHPPPLEPQLTNPPHPFGAWPHSLVPHCETGVQVQVVPPLQVWPDVQQLFPQGTV